MVIYEYPNKEDFNIGESVLALGFFDGVHVAHRNLLDTAKKEAQKKGYKFGIFTFNSFGGIKGESKRVYSDSEKCEIFESLGADFVIFADFAVLADCPPDIFVNKVLWEEIGCRVAVAGFNFRFGKRAAANARDLVTMMRAIGGDAIICEEITVSGMTLSTTLIRDLISMGQVKKANGLLGAPYYIKGTVLHGREDGGRMGFPTVNIEIADNKVVPKHGVYASATVVNGWVYPCITNIGECPTFGKRPVHLEAHIIDHIGDLYGKELRIYLIDYIRPERAFPSAESLKMQINADKNRVLEKYGDIKWQELGLK